MAPKGRGSNGPKAIQRATNSIDRSIGKQIKHYRTLAGISGDECAEAIGISAETLDAYERAKQRVSASHLAMLSAALGVDVAEFFERPAVKSQPASGGNVVPMRQPRKRPVPAADAEGRLLESFRAIQQESDRQLVLDITARLAMPCCSASGS